MESKWTVYCTVFLVGTITLGDVSASNYGRPPHCPNCAAVSCLPVSEIQCNPPNYIRPYGDKCGCCPACVRKPRPICKCELIRCAGVDENKCKPPKFYIDPYGDYCRCCPVCVKRRRQGWSG